MKKKIYIYYLNHNLLEGGTSRNNAFANVLMKNSRSINVCREGILGRLYAMVQIVSLFLTYKRKKIFIHQGAILFAFPVFLLKFRLYKYLFKRLLTFVQNNNEITVEVNDLPYEQAIDLGLPVKIEYKIFQQVVLSLQKVNYIFASKLMKDYAVKNYSLDQTKSTVILNGAPEFKYDNTVAQKLCEKFYNDKRLKFIYSGTLNSGRDIEQLIDLFSSNKDILLILIGANGDWINERVKLSENIFYLGSFDERTAHSVVSLCDVGLMHYDETKLYYNICFPTKASFYITAGIAVLSTPMEEIYQTFKGYFLFAKLSNWNMVIDSISREDIEKSKSNISKIKSIYTWENLIANSSNLF